MKDKKLLKQESKIRIYRYVLRLLRFLNFSFVFFPTAVGVCLWHDIFYL